MYAKFYVLRQHQYIKDGTLKLKKLLKFFISIKINKQVFCKDWEKIRLHPLVGGALRLSSVPGN